MDAFYSNMIGALIVLIGLSCSFFLKEDLKRERNELLNKDR
jgi:hypothetical protein